jgi:polyisoprenoid-binding protein YceI
MIIIRSNTRLLVAAASLTLCFVSSAAFAKDLNALFKLSPTGSFTAKSTDIKGEIKKNPDGSISSDRIEIPLTALKTGMGLRDEHMKNKYLEVGKYPSAIITDAKGKDGKGTAMLEVHGKKKPISGTYEIIGDEVELKFPVNITDYDIAKVKYMGVGVKDEALIDARIPLKK